MPWTAKHIFKFNNSIFENYTNLLCKYYPTVPITVNIKDKDPIKGIISKKFLETLPQSEYYEITTAEISPNVGSIQVLPRFVDIKSNKIFPFKVRQLADDFDTILKSNNGKHEIFSYKIKKLADDFDTILHIRSGIGEQTIYPYKVRQLADDIDDIIQSKLYTNTYMCSHFSQKKIDIDNFEQLLDVLKCIDTKGITRQYISKEDQCIFLVINDCHTIFINTKKISDVILPVFDVDDGFFGDSLLSQELNVFFNIWLAKFKNTNGDSWNDPIIQQN